MSENAENVQSHSDDLRPFFANAWIHVDGCNLAPPADRYSVSILCAVSHEGFYTFFFHPTKSQSQSRIFVDNLAPTKFMGI